MLEIDGVGMGVNWMRFLDETLSKPTPQPPQTQGQTGSQTPVMPPQITVQVDANSDPSKPTNEDISAANTLIQTLAGQYQPPPPDITVDDPTTKAAQAAIQDSQTQYDNAVTNQQTRLNTLTNLQSDPTTSAADLKSAQTDYTNAQTATAKAGHELEVTTDAGYMIAYAQQADSDKGAIAPAQTAADNATTALQKLMPGFDPKNPPPASACKTPQQLGAYDAWQKADASLAKANSHYSADVANSNLAYAQLQSHASDPDYGDAMKTSIANLNNKLAPLGLEVSAPPAIDASTAQTNLNSAAADANYANACLSAASDASQVADVQQTFDAVSGRFGPTVMATTVAQQQNLLTRAQTAAQTSGGYLQMLSANRQVDQDQTDYNNALSASNQWHKANPNAQLIDPQVDVTLGNAYTKLSTDKTQAGLAHDSFVAAYGNSLASQYDDAANGLQNQYDHRTMCAVNDPTPLEIKGLKTVASALHTADGRLSDSVNDQATKLALNAAQSDQTGAKSTLQTVQQQYDAWNSQHGGAADGPFVNVAQHGGPGHLLLTSVGPYQINPYTQQLSDARAALDAANNKVNQLQLMSDGAHDQVLFDQFNAGLSDNLLNPVTDSDKADYAKALDQFYESHRSELSQSMLGNASASTNKGQAYNFGATSATDQKNLIGKALGLQTAQQPGADGVQYDGDALKTINTVYNEIHKVGGNDAQVSILPIVYASKDSGMTTTALFKVTNKDGGDAHYVDDGGAKYSSIDDYINNNQLSSDGTVDIATGYNNGVLQVKSSAAHHDSFWESTLHTLGASNLNLGTLIGGVVLDVAGGVLDATGVGLPFGVSLNVIGTSMIYGASAAAVANSGYDLANRVDHDRTISPFDAGARADYINLIPVGAAGAAKAVTKFTGTELFAKAATTLGADSGKAASIVNKTAEVGAKASAFGGAVEAGGQLSYDVVTGHGNIAQDVSSLVMNVALVKGHDVLKATSTGIVRSRLDFAARTEDGQTNLTLGDQSVRVQRLANTSTDALTLDRNLASLDGKTVKVGSDGTLQVGNKVLTYDGMPVRVLNRGNADGYTGRGKETGASAVLGDDGGISVVDPTKSGPLRQVKLTSYDTGEHVTVGESGGLELSDNLSLSRPSELKTPQEVAATVAQLAGRNAGTPSSSEPAEPTAPRTSTPLASDTTDPLTRQATQNAETSLTESTVGAAQSMSEGLRSSTEVRERSQQANEEAHLTDSANRRSSETNAIVWRRANDPLTGNGVDEARPTTFQQRVAWTALNATEAPPFAPETDTGAPGGQPLTRAPLIEPRDYDGSTLYVVRNDASKGSNTLLGPDGQPLSESEAAPAARLSPTPAARPIVLIEGSEEAKIAPELANAWNEPVFVAPRNTLAADGTIRGASGFIRFDPAPRAPADAQGLTLRESGLYVAGSEALADAQAPRATDAPQTYRNGLYVPKDPSRTSDEDANTQAAGKARDSQKPTETEEADTDGIEFAHPEMEETVPAADSNKAGLLARLQMRFGGAPLPNEVSALAQQSGTLSQQLRMLNDEGWRVKVGREGRGSRIDAKKKRVTLDGGLREPGSMTYALAHEAKHAVEAIDGNSGLDYSGRSRFTRKALEAEARAQINAFEARYEIDMAGGGDIAAHVRLPDAIQREADAWAPTDDYAGTVERLTQAFAEAPVSGTSGKTYAQFYNEAYDRARPDPAGFPTRAARHMPAPQSHEPGAGPNVPEPLPTTREGLEAYGRALDAGLDRALARSPFESATRLSFAEELLNTEPHRLVLDDRFFSSRLEGGGDPIALPFSRPSDVTRARAQQLADITGVHVFAPRIDAPTEWEMLTPGPIRSGLDGPVEFDAQSGTFHVTGTDGTRNQIDPEAHLGQLRGIGAYKTALQLGDKTVVVYRELDPIERLEDDIDEPEVVDDPHDMIAKTQQLQALGAPYVARIDGVARIHGHDALVMDSYRAADRPLTRETEMHGERAPSTPVYDTSLFNAKSIESLSATRDWMVERNVAIGDLQFLISRDGTFYLADFESVTEGAQPRATSLQMIDDYIELAKARLARVGTPDDAGRPAAPVTPAATAQARTSDPGNVSDTSDTANARDTADTADTSGHTASFPERIEWTRARAYHVSPFGADVPDLSTLQREPSGRASKNEDRDLIVVHAETAPDGTLLLDGVPVDARGFTLDLGRTFAGDDVRVILAARHASPQHAAELANLWQQPIYVPPAEAIAADGTLLDASALTRYDPAPFGAPNLGELAADARGVYRDGDPARRLDAEQHAGAVLGYGAEKMVFELGHDAALGVLERGPRYDADFHRQAAGAELNALAVLRRFGLRTLSMSGPFSAFNRVAVLYRPLGIMHTHAIEDGELPARISRQGLAHLQQIRDVVARHEIDIDFQAMITRDGDVLVSDPGEVGFNDRLRNLSTLDDIDAVQQSVQAGVDSGEIELAHPDAEEIAQPGAFSQKPSLFTRIRMRFGGAPLPRAALDLIGHSELLTQQMRLWKQDGWKVVRGRAGEGSKVDAHNRRIVIDGKFQQAGAMVYVLAHEAGHAVEAIEGKLALDYSSTPAFAQSALRAEARAQLNAFAVRDEIKAATDGRVDIGTQIKLPDAIERECGRARADDPASVERLANVFGDVRTSLPGHPSYRAFYEQQASEVANGAAPHAMPAPNPNAGTPNTPATATAAQLPALTPDEARAAAWLDEHDLRTLRRIDGAHVPQLEDLARQAGRGAHILVAKQGARPVADAEHPQPQFVAGLATDEHGKLTKPQPLERKNVPRALTKALNQSAPNAAAERAKYDFYVSPVVADELARFGGAAKIEASNDKQSWQVAASGKPIDSQLTQDVAALADAPRFKRPKLAAQTVDAQQKIYAVEDKTGKVLGYAERNTLHEWIYHETTPVADTVIPEHELGAAFRRRAGRIPVGRAGRRGVSFIVSDREPAAVARVGGFEPAEKKNSAEPEKKPRRKAGDVGQLRLAQGREGARNGASRVSTAARKAVTLLRRQQALAQPTQPAGESNPLVELNLLPSPEKPLSVIDFSGHNALHLLRAIDQKSIGAEHYIYVYDTEGPIAETLGTPRGIIATRDSELRWFDNREQASNVNEPGVSLDEMPVGRGQYGANVHFLLTRLKPDEFLEHTAPTRLATLNERARVLKKQWKQADTLGKNSPEFEALATRIKATYDGVKDEINTLTQEWQAGSKSGNGGKKRTARAAAAASLQIEPYQPGLSTTTVVESNLRYGAAKLERWFPELGRIKAFNARSRGPADQQLQLNAAGRQTVMADPTMWKSLGNRHYVARDVPTTPSRFAPIPIKTLARRFGVANVADLRMIQMFVRSDPAIQDRIAPMSRAFALRDDPALMTAQIRRYGGVMPMVSLVVDPHSLAAALGQSHDPAFLREVRALGDQASASFDGENGVIEPAAGSGGEALALDDLHHLDRWLDEAAEAGFAIRLETAPSRALVSGKDQRFQAGTNDTYHDFVRTFSALDKWAKDNPKSRAPTVMVTFHGWDSVPESVPGAGHVELLKAVLDRPSLEWVHMGLSYGTHGTDFIANQDLTTALAQLIVDYHGEPGKLARLHGADALTRVFERVSPQALADQHQLLFAEVERLGRAQGMTPEQLDTLHRQLYEGNTTALLNRARLATIDSAEKGWTASGNPPRGRTEKLARTFSIRWKNEIGAHVSAPQVKTLSAKKAGTADPAGHWRAVVADPALRNDGSKPISASRKAAAQLSPQPIAPEQRAEAELHALRVHARARGWRNRLRSGGLIAVGTPSALVLGGNSLNLLHTFGSEGLHHTATSLFVGTRAGRVFQALHQGAVASLKNGDPRVFDAVVGRLERGLRSQLGANSLDEARVNQLSLIAQEGRLKAAQLRAMNNDGQLSFDDTVTHTKAVAADMLAQMQGVVGGTSLKRLHHGSPRHAVGLIGRGAAIVGYSATIATNIATITAHHGVLAPVLTTLGASLGMTYTSLVYLSNAHEVNADKRSRVTRFVDAASDYVTSAAGFASAIVQIGEGHPVLGGLAITSATILGAGRLHTQFPNATPGMERFPTVLALAPVGIFAGTLIQSFLSGGSSQNTKNPGNTQHLQQPGASASPAPGLLPSGVPTAPSVSPTPGAGVTSTSPSPSSSKSAPAPGSTSSTQPAPTGTPSATPPSNQPKQYFVVEGDSLWVIADRNRRSLLDAAHVPAADQQKMSRNRQDAMAFDEVLQLNPSVAKHPASIDPGQLIIVG
ncbi:LWXIA domain-containing protein [Paraburkholderia sediminicola]|uniref:LWXIA domain-containing protein n=1 Tax=Paraburkholderia sediminicola TaxID=458836 RepID=UPI0038BBF259